MRTASGILNGEQCICYKSLCHERSLKQSSAGCSNPTNGFQMGTILTSTAALELMRQSAVAGIPGEMHAELVSGGCSDYAIVFKAGRNSGEPISRESGVTLYSSAEQVKLFSGIVIDYQESLSGGGFFLSGKLIDVSSCGNCFSFRDV